MDELLDPLISRIKARCEAGETASDLYLNWAQPSRWYRWFLPFFWLWRLNRALDLHDYATQNEPLGEVTRWYHLRTFGRRLIAGYDSQDT